MSAHSLSVSSRGGWEIFVAKIDNSGSWQWVQGAGDSNSDYGHGISTDASGNVYATGYFYSRATFGTARLSSYGSGDIFVAKLDGSGNWKWAAHGGGLGEILLNQL